MNERMARKVDYLQEEVWVLKEALATATCKKRIQFTAEQRRRLAVKGKALTPEERSSCCQIVRPATILAWFRQLAMLVPWRSPTSARAEQTNLKMVVCDPPT
jgi:hypothetical protein